MAYNPNLPVFADRYRFEPVGDDWDRGRSGYTHLVYDLKEKRMGVIKRAETSLKQSTEELKSEVKVLKTLKGLSVPEVYDTGQAIYGSKNYDYMVIEYIDGIRVEKNLGSLSIVERAEIITKLFDLLSQAHQKGIVNGDVDLKHLFWRREKKQLVVIDWGNAKLGVDPKKKAEYAYDLARAAEIIFSLVTRQGHPSATGSIALPDDSAIVAGLESLPVELCNLCKWAPRTPSDGAQAPYTAQELYEVSKKWLNVINDSKSFKPLNLPSRPRGRLLLVTVLIFLILITFLFGKFLLTSMPSSEAVVPEPSSTALVLDIPDPKSHIQPITFSKNQAGCSDWKNTSSTKFDLSPKDGFGLGVDKNWQFEVDKTWKETDQISTDFSNCFNSGQIGAISLNAWIEHIAPFSEFGIFLLDINGRRREYTLWIDADNNLFVRIRDNKKFSDYKQQMFVSSLDRQFSANIFLEINNQNLDILYLNLGSGRIEKDPEDIIPSQMIRIDSAVRTSLSDIQSAGLIGRGVDYKVILWPLTLFGK